MRIRWYNPGQVLKLCQAHSQPLMSGSHHHHYIPAESSSLQIRTGPRRTPTFLPITGSWSSFIVQSPDMALRSVEAPHHVVSASREARLSGQDKASSSNVQRLGPLRICLLLKLTDERPAKGLPFLTESRSAAGSLEEL